MLSQLILRRCSKRTLRSARSVALAAACTIAPFSASIAAPFDTLYAFSDSWQLVVDSDYIEPNKNEKDSIALLIQIRDEQLSFNSDLTPGGLDDTQTHYEFEMMDGSGQTLPLVIDIIKSSCQYKDNILPWSATIAFDGQSFAACASPTLEPTPAPSS